MGRAQRDAVCCRRVFWSRLDECSLSRRLQARVCWPARLMASPAVASLTAPGGVFTPGWALSFATIYGPAIVAVCCRMCVVELFRGPVFALKTDEASLVGVRPAA